MSIEATPGHFTRREEAVLEIESNGQRLIEVEILPGQFTPTPHVHDYGADIYLIEGLLEIHEPDTGRTYLLEAGSKIVIPAQTLHSEHSSGTIRAVFGLSADKR